MADNRRLSRRRWQDSFRSGAAEAFRIDWGWDRPSVKDRLDSYIQALDNGDVSGNDNANDSDNDNDDVEAVLSDDGAVPKNPSGNDDDDDDDIDELNVDIHVNNLWGDNKPLTPSTSVTAARIKRMYKEIGNDVNSNSNSNGDRNRYRYADAEEDSSSLVGDKIVCVLKLCLAELACGEIHVSVEEHFRRVSIALKLDDTPQVNITSKSITAQFRSGPVVMIECRKGILISKLREVEQISVLLQQGK